MIVESIDPVVPRPNSGSERSPGVHISSVIRNIAFENKVLKAEWIEDFDLIEVSGSSDQWWSRLSPDVQLKVAMGLAWEEYYGNALGDVAYHPGEMELDGIYMTHDGESVTFLRLDAELALHEFKLTYKSTKTVGELATQWLWLAQMKAYCKALGTGIAYMHVLFVCGDYKFPIRPQLKVWRLTFTERELDDNWELMTSFVEHRRNQEREDAMRDTE